MYNDSSTTKTMENFQDAWTVLIRETNEKGKCNAFNDRFIDCLNDVQDNTRVNHMASCFYKLYTDTRFHDLKVNAFNGVEDMKDHLKFLNDQNRQCIKVRFEAIEAYVKDIIFHEENQGEVETYKLQLTAWHQSIPFANFLQTQGYENFNSLSNCKDEFLFCEPTGLRNLGATCYLNGFLQCLSSNLLFIREFFKWNYQQSKNGRSEKMINAVSELQNVLLSIIYGADRVVCTIQFALSLGLVSDEMQDPNEFARLLFDRMHESFRNIDAISLSNERGGKGEESMNLACLLPNLFKGKFKYTTECMECKQAFYQNEDFMDLLLPIIFGTKRRGKKRSIQDCLDQYTRPETMKGDYKYHCSSCNKKCDAKRSILFHQTPSILNIQLARYIYDIKVGAKKKLMDEVIINRTINIKTADGVSVQYILYAVQNHRGKSAHNGHYVAEAMDWASGVWFEYDDEKVTFLEDGPTGTKGNVGSSDAYNLFYVETTSLRQSVQNNYLLELNDVPTSVEKTHAGRLKVYEDCVR